MTYFLKIANAFIVLPFVLLLVFGSSFASSDDTKINLLLMELKTPLKRSHLEVEKEIWSHWSKSGNQNLDFLLVSSSQKIDFIFFLNVNKDTIIKRIEKRKVLEKRSDDDSSTILKRYDTYMETTRPVLDYYSKNPNFYEIDGTLEIDQITSKINDILGV